MKRTLTLALGAVLTASAVPAFSQDNFPDAPDNHWAWQALKNMKDAGLLVGYPDGLFRGSRPASRYELAVAIHATYQHLKGLIDGLQAQQKALQDKVDNMSTEGFATKDELRQVRDALATVSAAVDGMKSWGDDIAALKKMSSTFEKELASMGVDVEAMKKALQDLADRVGALEKKKLPVDIHGTVDMVLLGGYSVDDEFGITVDGRPTGVGRGDNENGPAGATEDLTILHQGALVMSGTNDEGPKWKMALVINNMLDEAASSGEGFSSGSTFGNMSSLNTGIPFQEDRADFYVQELNATFDTSLWGQNFSATIGRVGAQFGSYFFRRPDTTPYFKSEYWDDGDWYFDGGVFAFKFGGASLNLFGGRQSEREGVDGDIDLNPMWAGQAGHIWDPNTLFLGDRPVGFGDNRNGIMVDQHLGVNLNIPAGKSANVMLNYIILDSNSSIPISTSPVVLVNRAIVYGGALDLSFGDNIKLNAGVSKTNLNFNDDTELDEDNTAWWARLNWARSEKWGFGVGYRSIDPQFYAPGYWGRIGMWWNPTDIEGFMANVWFNFNDRMSLGLDGGFYKGRGVDLDGVEGFTEDDKVNSFKAHFNYKLNDSWDLMLNHEWVRWDLDARGAFAGGEPTENWYRLGLKYKMGGGAFWSFLWEMSDYDSDDTSGWGPFFGGGDVAKGGLINVQFGIKF